jgi:DnaK suppressor protein
MADSEVRPDARALLDEERHQLQEQLDELSTESDAAMSFDENFADSAQVAAEQGENRALAQSLREQLSDVDGALERLDAGTYGLCVRCGQAINPERLEAMPATPHCIACA